MAFTVFPLSHFLTLDVALEGLNVRLPSGGLLLNVNRPTESRMDYVPTAAENRQAAADRAERVKLYAERVAELQDMWTGEELPVELENEEADLPEGYTFGMRV